MSTYANHIPAVHGAPEHQLPATSIWLDLGLGLAAGTGVGATSGLIAGTCVFPLYGSVVGLMWGSLQGMIGGLMLGFIIHVRGWRNDGTAEFQARYLGAIVGAMVVMVPALAWSILGMTPVPFVIGAVLAIPSGLGSAWAGTMVLASQSRHWLGAERYEADWRYFWWCLGVSMLPLLGWVLALVVAIIG